MFSNNQIFKVSGPVDQIERVLRFAFELEGQDKHMTKGEKERGCKTVYQISEDGRYFCVGWGFEEIPPGWNDFDPTFTYKRAAVKIEEFLKNFNSGDPYYRAQCLQEVNDVRYHAQQAAKAWFAKWVKQHKPGKK